MDWNHWSELYHIFIFEAVDIYRILICVGSFQILPLTAVFSRHIEVFNLNSMDILVLIKFIFKMKNYFLFHFLFLLEQAWKLYLFIYFKFWERVFANKHMLASKSWCFCFSLLRAGFAGMHRRSQLYIFACRRQSSGCGELMSFWHWCNLRPAPGSAFVFPSNADCVHLPFSVLLHCVHRTLTIWKLASMIADMGVPAGCHLRGEDSAATGWHSRVTGSYVLSVVSNTGSPGSAIPGCFVSSVNEWSRSV